MNTKRPAAKPTSKRKITPKAASVEVEVQTVSAASSSLTPTSYTEINRLHGNALGVLSGAVVVTAAREGEGSSLLAYTMALKSAESGTKTLLVDLNMKSHGLTKQLNLARKAWGLSSAELPRVLGCVEHDDMQPNLSYLGAPTDAQSIAWLKDHNHAKAFFDELGKTYSQIIIDTTPVGLTNRANADPVLLAGAAARTVLITLAGVTPPKQVKRAAHQLEKAGAVLAGIVLNDWQNPSLKDDMMKLVAGLQKRTPGLASWLRHKVLNSDSLS